MTIHRFYIEEVQVDGDRVTLPSEISYQITKVLRLSTGDIIVVFDKQKTEYTIMLGALQQAQGKYTAVGRVIKQGENNTESSTTLNLYQSLLPREKFEEVLQKNTEIGISAFYPLETARTIVGKKDVREEKLQRWQKITQEAAEQSERGLVPKVHQPLLFKEAIEQAVKDGIVLIAWEEEKNNHPTVILNKVKNLIVERRSFASAQDDNSYSNEVIALFIGPEGGFTPEEIEFAKNKGAQTVSLGPRILRSETAGIVLASLVLFSFGELDRSTS